MGLFMRDGERGGVPRRHLPLRVGGVPRILPILRQLLVLPGSARTLAIKICAASHANGLQGSNSAVQWLSV